MNDDGPDLHALSHVLDALAAAAEDDEVRVEDLVETLGRRSFPALILAPSLIAVSPASGIPGLTSTVGLLVATVTAQMLVTRPLVVLPLSVMVVIGLMMPLLELVPMSGSIAAALISIYAVGLLMRDGVLVLLALGLSVAVPLGVWHLAA